MKGVSALMKETPDSLFPQPREDMERRQLSKN